MLPPGDEYEALVYTCGLILRPRLGISLTVASCCVVVLHSVFCLVYLVYLVCLVCLVCTCKLPRDVARRCNSVVRGLPFTRPPAILRRLPPANLPPAACHLPTPGSSCSLSPFPSLPFPSFHSPGPHHSPSLALSHSPLRTSHSACASRESPSWLRQPVSSSQSPSRPTSARSITGCPALRGRCVGPIPSSSFEFQD